MVHKPFEDQPVVHHQIGSNSITTLPGATVKLGNNEKRPRVELNQSASNSDCVKPNVRNAASARGWTTNPRSVCSSEDGARASASAAWAICSKVLLASSRAKFSSIPKAIGLVSCVCLQTRDTNSSVQRRADARANWRTLNLNRFTSGQTTVQCGQPNP
jgi:hypothetical protein